LALRLRLNIQTQAGIDSVTAESAFIAAALVGIIHMSAPDHWATLAVLGRSAKWTLRKLISATLVSAFGHVALSIFLGLAIVELANLFSAFASAYFAQAIGIIMIVSGLYVGVSSLRAKNNESKGKGQPRLAKSTGYFAVLGAALSPDLSILPILLIAMPLGIITMVHTLVIFAVSSILTDLLLVVAFSVLFSRAVDKLPSKYNDAFVGFVIAAVGVYVLIFG